MMDEELKKLIENNALALSTVDEDGRPHVIAVGFAKVVNPKQIVITDNYMATTPRNIKRTGEVALAVWNREWEKECTGFELRGSAEYLTSGEWLDFVKKMPENEGEPCKAAILVTVREIKKLA